MQKLLFPVLIAFALLTQAGCKEKYTTASGTDLERGRYLVSIAGCNDCHTTGYSQAGGKLPEAQWLLGDNVGWRGPWGTTYPVNLRLFMQALNEEQWIAYARHNQARPPMPGYALAEMPDADLKAIYRFVRSLGAAGIAAPAYVPPDQEPKTAYINFVPQPPKP